MGVVKYHPALVVLHWLMAVLLIGALGLGLTLALTPNSDPGKLDLLEWHMAGGMAILALMLIRLVVRWRTRKPAAEPLGFPVLDRLAPLIHYAFYIVVPLTVGFGYATGILAHLPASVFARTGEPLPEHFTAYPTFIGHALLAMLLAALIGLHVAAAVWHQWGRKDGLMGRMGFGPR